jgi:hypothetical protein
MAIGLWEVLNEIHRNGIPRPFWYGKLFQESVRFVTRCFQMFASGTQVAEVFHKGLEVGPYVISTDEVKGIVLSSMSGQDVIMIVLEDFEAEVISIRDVNLVVLTEKSAFVKCPVGCGGSGKISRRDGIEG